MARLEPGEHVFHIALATDWAAAVDAGDYRVSTRGRTLDEEGYIHASRAHQVDGVRRGFYADVEEPLLLLEIDPELLGVELRLERPPGAPEEFPHIYGPIPLAAVVRVSGDRFP
jgi:uncharacterized protein (DUF952 family)